MTTEAPSGRQLRADAARNVDAILDAAERLLVTDPAASMAAIAAAAGVGRVTVYSHFASRASLVDAVFKRAVTQADVELRAVDTDGDPQQALVRLITASWRMVERNRLLLIAAQGELPEGGIRGHHDRVLRRLTNLVTRGQREGVFRDDLPRQWLVSVCYSLMHAAADEVSRGRLKPDQAPTLILDTLLAAISTAI